MLSRKAAATSVVTTSDSESVKFSGESELCMEHESDLDWFCSSEQKRICLHCTIVGPCQSHIVTPLVSRVTGVRVSAQTFPEIILSRCSLFVETVGKRTMQVSKASGAREQVVAQVSVVREAVEEEEQRLLEAVQREEERVEQCLLTQRTRTRLVHTLTNTPDIQLAVSKGDGQRGVDEPHDTDHLNLNASCSDSKLMRGLWASAILLGPTANLTFDERTVSSALSLSEDLCTLTFLPKWSRQSPPYNPARFDCWPNALGTLAISSGTHSWVIDMGESGAFKVGVCYSSMGRKGSGNDSRLGYNIQSWVLSKYNGDFSFCHPKSLGLLLDWPSQTLIFYDPDSSAVLHSVRHAFSGPLLPAFAVADCSVSILH
uniref:B-box and SPRY domain containing n=1 Tax=Oncorhynchus mykiss TaxID=8022 RepID=A0A8K9XVA0_ONCMY